MPAVKNTFPPEVVIESELMVPVLLITDAFKLEAALAAIIICPPFVVIACLLLIKLLIADASTVILVN